MPNNDMTHRCWLFIFPVTLLPMYQSPESLPLFLWCPEGTSYAPHYHEPERWDATCPQRWGDAVAEGVARWSFRWGLQAKISSADSGMTWRRALRLLQREIRSSQDSPTKIRVNLALSSDLIECTSRFLRRGTHHAYPMGESLCAVNC